MKTSSRLYATVNPKRTRKLRIKEDKTTGDVYVDMSAAFYDRVRNEVLRLGLATERATPAKCFWTLFCHAMSHR